MPKAKTNRGAVKRVRVSKKGRIKFRHAFTSHLDATYLLLVDSALNATSYTITIVYSEATPRNRLGSGPCRPSRTGAT